MKKINYLIGLLLLVFGFSAVANARMYSYADNCTGYCIKSSDVVVGTALITNDYILQHDITSEILMFSSTTVTGNSISDMKMYYHLGSGAFYEVISGASATLPEQVFITIVDGVCVDDSCRGGALSTRTVTFNYLDESGNNVPVSRTVKYGDIIPAKEVPIVDYRPGFKFVGWTDGNNRLFDMSTPITSNITLTASYQTISYKIYSNLNYGTHTNEFIGNCTLDTSGLGINDACMTPDEPTRIGYDFKGWSFVNSDAGSELLPENQSITSILGASDETEIVLYAIWEPQVYTINYHLNGGNGSAAQIVGTMPGQYTYDPDTGITLGSPTRYGYKFVHWYLNEQGTGDYLSTTKGKSSDLDLYAKWTPKTFTVKYFDSRTGTAVQVGSDQSCTYDDCSVRATQPEGNGFKYWYDSTNGYMYKASNRINSIDSGSANMANINLTAVFNSDGTHSIKYYDGGVEVNNNFINEYVVGVGTNLPSMTKNGYIFNGWKDRATNTIIPAIDETKTTDVVLDADWTEITKTITYDANGGTLAGGDSTYTCHFGSANCKAPADPTNAGYKFLGWSLTNSAAQLVQAGVDYLPIINGSGTNLKLHAIWEEITYLVRYDTDGGVANFANATLITGYSRARNRGVITLPPNPVREGYDFNGWKYNSNVITVTDGVYSLKPNVTEGTEIDLIARWNRIPLNIVYHNKDNQNYDSQTCDYQSSCIINLANPSHPEGSYNFKYWLDVNDGYIFKRGDEITNLYGNIVLEAVYNDEDTHSISYANSVTFVETPINEFVTGVGANLPELKKDGYTFTGWTNTKYTSPIKAIPANETEDVTGLTPNWSNNSYKIVYVLGDDATNNPSNPSEFEYEGEDIVINPPIRTNYSFVGWDLISDDGFVLRSEEGLVYTYAPSAPATLVLAAAWKNNSYNIIYDLNGGSLPSGASNPEHFIYNPDGYSTTLPTPTRNGFEFDGWSLVHGTATLDVNDSTSILINGRGDVYLSAKWEALNYSISYNLGSGVTLTGETPTSYNANTNSIQIPDAHKDNYVFTGWSVTPSDAATYANGVLTIQTPSALELEPTFDRIAATVQYCDSIDSNRECVDEIETISVPDNLYVGDSIVAANVPNDSLSNRFIYWMTDDGRFFSPGNSILLTGDLVIYPYYYSLENVHTITYNTNGGTFINGDPLNKYYDGDSFAIDTQITKTNATFGGWYTEPEFVNPISSVENKHVDLDLYAKWIPYPECDFSPEVRIITEGNTQKALVTFDMVNEFTSEHYISEIVAYYPDNHVVDPRMFNYGDEVVAEFTYIEGMYIEVRCNNDEHLAIIIEEDDFYVVPVVNDCDFTPDVSYIVDAGTVRVTFDSTNVFTAEHYISEIVAYYPDNHVVDPRMFNYGDEVVAEFTYIEGMYIEIRCSNDSHEEITIPDTDFTVVNREPCDLNMDAVVDTVNLGDHYADRVTVSYAYGSLGSETHYVKEITAVYIDGDTNTLSFDYDDVVSAEFPYEEDMYIIYKCNDDEHAISRIDEDDFIDYRN